MGVVLTRLLAVFEVIADMVVLTLAFLLGTLAGGVLLGVAPSLEALLYASRERYVALSGTGAWRLFWRHWRGQFKASNRRHLAPVLILVFLLYDYALLQANLFGSLRLPALAVIGVLVAWAALALIHGLREQLVGRGSTFLSSLALVFTRPWHNLAFATITFALVRLTSLVNGFWLLLLWGAWGWAVTIVGERLDARRASR